MLKGPLLIASHGSHLDRVGSAMRSVQDQSVADERKRSLRSAGIQSQNRAPAQKPRTEGGAAQPPPPPDSSKSGLVRAPPPRRGPRVCHPDST